MTAEYIFGEINFNYFFLDKRRNRMRFSLKITVAAEKYIGNYELTCDKMRYLSSFLPFSCGALNIESEINVFVVRKSVEIIIIAWSGIPIIKIGQRL